MRFILSFLSILMLTLIGISCQKTISSPTAQSPASDKQNITAQDSSRISLQDAKKDFDAGAAVFVDSRAEAVYKQNHIKGAINITFADIEARWKEIPTSKKIIVYCS